MADNESSRHQLPFLVVAQAQKEITHNEALARIDTLLHPVVQGSIAEPPILSQSDSGKCWLISAGASGAWQGKSGHIAYWTGGSWRYLSPVEGMRVKNLSNATEVISIAGQWTIAPTIADPQLGAVIDVEARAAIVTLLSHFRMIGQLAS